MSNRVSAQIAEITHNDTGKVTEITSKSIFHCLYVQPRRNVPHLFS